MNILIYADFNGMTRIAGDENQFLDICGFGTLRSLSHYKIRLREGMALTFFEPGDLEWDATVHFYPNEIDANNPNGKWLAKLIGDQRDNHTPESAASFPHLCFKCRSDLNIVVTKISRYFSDTCPVCTTPVKYPLLPPNNE